MGKIQHTPGSLTACPCPKHGVSIADNDKGTLWLVQYNDGEYEGETAICVGEHAKANAHLYASATELLAELKHLVALLGLMELASTLNVPGLATLNGAREAIAKAEKGA